MAMEEGRGWAAALVATATIAARLSRKVFMKPSTQRARSFLMPFAADKFQRKKRPPMKGALRVSGLWGAKVAGDTCQTFSQKIGSGGCSKNFFFFDGPLGQVILGGARGRPGRHGMRIEAFAHHGLDPAILAHHQD